MVHKKSPPTKWMEEDTIPETDVSRKFIQFFTGQLKEIYWAEKQLAKALPKMKKAATADGLKVCMGDHLSITSLQEERLERVFELLSETPRTVKSDAASDLLEEAKDVLKITEKGTRTRDIDLLFALQKIKNYEIGAYTSLIQFARTMGNEDIISLLEETLSEEDSSAESLKGLTEGSLNDLVTGHSTAKLDDIAKAAATYDSVNLTGKIKRNTS